MRNRVCSSLCYLLILSCGNGDSEPVKTQYYESGNIKTKTFLFSDKNTRVQKFYDDDNNKTEIEIEILNDSVNYLKFYDEEEKLVREGKAVNELPFGIWKDYENSRLNKITEYISLNKKLYDNQRWVLNNTGDTIGGYHFEVQYDSISKVEQPARFHFFLKRPFFKDSNRVYLIHPKKTFHLKRDFSNRKVADMDTIFSIGTKHQYHEELRNLTHDVVIDVFTQDKVPGTFRFRGVLVEEDSKRKTRDYYFDLGYTKE